MESKADVAPEGAPPRVVKRYANRKLYDTRDSRYVTLQQIGDLIRQGEDVRIIDNTTKEDLTHVTLAQIIYEQEKNGDGGGDKASLRTLRSFIQQGRDRLMTSLREGPMGKLVTRRDEEADDPEDAEAEVNDQERREGRKSVSPKEAFDDLSRLADERVKALVGGAMGHVQQLQAEVRRLQARIEELEQRLVALTRRNRDKAGSEPPPSEEQGG